MKRELTVILKFSVFCILLILSGCLATSYSTIGSMLPGKMFSLKDGTELKFSVEISTGTGNMTAFNPSTGESFTGQYTGIYTGGGVSQSTSSSGILGLSSRTVTTNSAPTGAIAKGILRGDKGTIINVSMDIQPGDPPKGFGEGIDNNEVHYQIQF